MQKSVAEEVQVFALYVRDPTIPDGVDTHGDDLADCNDIPDDGDDGDDSDGDNSDDDSDYDSDGDRAGNDNVNDDDNDGADVDGDQVDVGAAKPRSAPRTRPTLNAALFPNLKQLFIDTQALQSRLEVANLAVHNPEAFPNLLWSTDAVRHRFKVFPGTTCPVARYLAMKSPHQHQSRDRNQRVRERAPLSVPVAVGAHPVRRRNRSEVTLLACCGKVWSHVDVDGELIQCHSCKLWCHFDCEGISEAPAKNARFTCGKCSPDQHSRLVHQAPVPKRIAAKRQRLEPGARAVRTPDRINL